MLDDVDIQFSFDDGSEASPVLDFSSVFAAPDPAPTPDLTPTVDPNTLPPAPDGGTSHGPAPVDPTATPDVAAGDDASVVLNINSSFFDSVWSID